MNEKVKRPPSVWITQVLLIIFALLFSLIWLNSLRLFAAPQSKASGGRFLIFTLIMLILLGMLSTAFWGLVKRRVYGRWLGIVSLIFIWGLLVYIQLFPSKGPYKRYEYDNATQLYAAYLWGALIYALFLILILRLAFSKNIGRFFQRKTEEVVT